MFLLGVTAATAEQIRLGLAAVDADSSGHSQ
jgi:hypothetical protein